MKRIFLPGAAALIAAIVLFSQTEEFEHIEEHVPLVWYAITLIPTDPQLAWEFLTQNAICLTNS